MGFSGWADDPAAITLVFYVGSNRRRVEIESAKHELLHSRFHERHLAFRLLFNGSAARMRYPVMIERATSASRLLVGTRVFKGCSIGERLAVATNIDNVRVTVWCPDGHPGEGLALARIEGRELDAFIREERKHWASRPASEAWRCSRGRVSLRHIGVGSGDSSAGSGYRPSRVHAVSVSPGSDAWCGNAGWFPGYPLLMGFVGRLGIGIAPAGLVLAWLFTLGTLVLLWGTFLQRRLESGAVAALVYAAFAPGMVFGYGMYPLSMLAFCTVVYLWLVSRERWGWAGLAGAVVVLVYPVGLAAPAAVAVYLMVAYRAAPPPIRIRALVLAVGPAVISIGLYLLQLQLAVGHWNAYFLRQELYGHQLREPFASLVHAVGTLIDFGSFNLRSVSALQTLLVTSVLVSVLVVVFRRRPLLRGDLLIAFWAVATWPDPCCDVAPCWPSWGERVAACRGPGRAPAGQAPDRVRRRCDRFGRADTVLYLRGALS